MHAKVWRKRLGVEPRRYICKQLILRSFGDFPFRRPVQIALAVIFLAVPTSAQIPPGQQVIFGYVDTPAAESVVTAPVFAGWALNCRTRQQPTSIRIFTFEGDRMIPIPVELVLRGYRPDVPPAFGTYCGATLSDWMGWSAIPVGPLPSGRHQYIIVISDPEYGAWAGWPAYFTQSVFVTVP